MLLTNLSLDRDRRSEYMMQSPFLEASVALATFDTPSRRSLQYKEAVAAGHGNFSYHATRRASGASTAFQGGPGMLPWQWHVVAFAHDTSTPRPTPRRRSKPRRCNADIPRGLLNQCAVIGSQEGVLAILFDDHIGLLDTFHIDFTKICGKF